MSDNESQLERILRSLAAYESMKKRANKLDRAMIDSADLLTTEDPSKVFESLNLEKTDAQEHIPDFITLLQGSGLLDGTSNDFGHAYIIGVSVGYQLKINEYGHIGRTDEHES